MSPRSDLLPRLEAVETQLTDPSLCANERLATHSRKVDDLAALVVTLIEGNRALRQSLLTRSAPSIERRADS